MSFYSIIPAGGSGTRLWPVSNSNHPKFLYDFFGRGKSLIQETYERLDKISDDIFIVCGKEHNKSIKKQIPSAKNIITEPSPKNSTGAIGVATYVIAKKYGEDSIVGSFAADQIIDGDFKGTVKKVIPAVKKGYIATIGIRASIISTAYGYIKKSNKKIGDVTLVDEFVEKPDEQTADHYIKTRKYFWNAGIFIFTAKSFIESLAELNPKMHELFTKVADLILKKKDFSKEWNKLESIAIDYQIAEPCSKKDKMVVVPADFTWSDIGDWNSVSNYLSGNIKGNKNNVIAEGCNNVFVYNSNHRKKISLVGLNDVSIINTDDEILVVKNKSAQKVKKIAEERENEKK